MPAQRLYECLERLSNWLQAELRKSAAQHGLKQVQLEALEYLAHANRYSDSPAALAEALKLTKGTVSQTVLALEAKGLVAKLPDERDGRVWHCRPTAKGRDIVREAFPPQPLEQLTRSLSPERLALHVELLEELLRAAQQQRGYRTFGVCRTCRHFRREGDAEFRCGLTGEKLLPADSLLRCREHTSA